MDFSLYSLLIKQLSPQPDISVVLNGDIHPEEWPVVLSGIKTQRRTVCYFTVTDGKTTVRCLSKSPDLYRRIAQTELGTIIHLMGAKSIYDELSHQWVLHIEEFATLKQYNDMMQRIRNKEAQRMADLYDELKTEYQHYY